MSELVVSFIEALGTKKVLLVGHSMGGAVALTTALSRPELVSGLLLVASGARLRVAQPLLKAVREQFHLLPELMARMVFSPQTPPEVVEAQRPLLFDAPAETVASDLEACDRFDAEPELGGLAVPVTVLVGSEDFLTPPRLGRRLAERAPRSRGEIVQGAGHLLPQEQPAVVSELILELLRGAGTR